MSLEWLTKGIAALISNVNTVKSDMEEAKKRIENTDKNVSDLVERIEVLEERKIMSKKKPTMKPKKQITFLCKTQDLIKIVNSDSLAELLTDYIIVTPLEDNKVEIMYNLSLIRNEKYTKKYSLNSTKTTMTITDHLCLNMTKQEFEQYDVYTDFDEIEYELNENSKVYHQKYLRFKDE